MSESKIEHDIIGQICVASAAMWALHWTVMLDRGLSLRVMVPVDLPNPHLWP